MLQEIFNPSNIKMFSFLLNFHCRNIDVSYSQFQYCKNKIHLLTENFQNSSFQIKIIFAHFFVYFFVFSSKNLGRSVEVKLL